jgi:hypothetical protein
MKTILALLALATGSQAQTTINGGRQITGNLDFTNSNSATVSFPNAGSTGTTLNKLAKLTGAPSTAVITATSDTNGAVGIVTTGAGTTGSAFIARFGITPCVFDGATTANDYVQISGTTAGDCHDSGATIPSSGQVIGAVLSTNGSGGTYNVLIWPEGNVGSNGGGGGGGILTLATGSGSPGGNCTAPSSGNLAAYTDTTTQDLWICLATNIWKKVLSTTTTGVFVQTGATGTSPGAPASGNVTCYYDSTANTMLCLDPGGNVFASVKTASSRTANQFMTYVNSLGLPQTAAIAAADIPNLSGTYCALSGCSMFGTLITPGVNAGGVWPSAIDIDTLGSPGGNWGNIYTDAITMPSQTAKTFFAAPTGSAGVPTFRALASADLPATVVLTNQANTYSAGLQDFSGATGLKIPTSAGLTATASLMFGYDSTAGLPHIWYSAADHVFGTAAFSATSAFQAALTNYSTISGLTGYPSTFPPTTTGLCPLTGCSFTGAISTNSSVDLRSATHTLPALTVASAGSLPGTCTAGELAFVTGATAGRNIYECGSTNNWTQELNSGVTSFSGDGTFATNSASAGGVTLTLNTVGAHKYWGNNTGSTAAGAYDSLVIADLPTSAVTRTAFFTDLAPVVGDSGLILLINPATAIHLTRAFCAVQGSTNVVVNLDKRTEGSIGTDSGTHLLGSDLMTVSTGANTSTFANGSSQCGGTSSCAIAAHAPVVVTFTSVSGTPTALSCSVDYTVD